MKILIGISLVMTLFATQVLANDNLDDISTGSDVDIMNGAPGNFGGAQLPEVTEPETPIQEAHQNDAAISEQDAATDDADSTI